jgi:hypothetical protein
MAIYARDLDEGTVTDDGTGHPIADGVTTHSRSFVPNDAQIFFKLTNPHSEAVVLQHVRVRLATAEDEAEAGDQATVPTCGTGYEISAVGPLRTTVSEREVQYDDSQLSLAIELAPCESILIEALGATPGIEHIVRIGVEITGETDPFNGYLEIWDGECND